MTASSMFFPPDCTTWVRQREALGAWPGIHSNNPPQVSLEGEQIGMGGAFHSLALKLSTSSTNSQKGLYTGASALGRWRNTSAPPPDLCYFLYLKLQLKNKIFSTCFSTSLVHLCKCPEMYSIFLPRVAGKFCVNYGNYYPKYSEP